MTDPFRIEGVDDWRAGDLALCLNDEPCPYFGNALRTKGAVYTVMDVKVLKDVWGRDNLALKMDRGNPIHPTRKIEGYSNAICFRKIRPHLPDAEDAETIRLLNSVKVPAHAGEGA